MTCSQAVLGLPMMGALYFTYSSVLCVRGFPLADKSTRGRTHTRAQTHLATLVIEHAKASLTTRKTKNGVEIQVECSVEEEVVFGESLVTGQKQPHEDRHCTRQDASGFDPSLVPALSGRHREGHL